MTKNILVGALVVILVGALAVATLDLLGGSSSADGGQQHGRSAQEEGRGNESVQSDGSEQQGNGYGRQVAEDSPVAASGSASNGQGHGRGAAGQQGAGQSDSTKAPSDDIRGGEANPDPQVDVEEWEKFEGKVAAFDDEGLTIGLGADQEMSIEMGPSWYWQEQAEFSAEIGDLISVSGFFEDDKFVAGTITNQTSGQVLVLRTEEGRPMWAGRGRGGQR